MCEKYINTHSHREQLYEVCAKNMLLAYFYVQYSEYIGNRKIADKNKGLYKVYLDYVNHSFGSQDSALVDFAYQNPSLYEQAK